MAQCNIKRLWSPSKQTREGETEKTGDIKEFYTGVEDAVLCCCKNVNLTDIPKTF